MSASVSGLRHLPRTLERGPGPLLRSLEHARDGPRDRRARGGVRAPPNERMVDRPNECMYVRMDARIHVRFYE